MGNFVFLLKNNNQGFNQLQILNDKSERELFKYTSMRLLYVIALRWLSW